LPENVEDAFAIRPPDESTLNSVSAVLSTNRRKSPAKTDVEEAMMREYAVVSVEVARTRNTALSWMPDVICEEVPTRTEIDVEVGARKPGLYESNSHA